MQEQNSLPDSGSPALAATPLWDIKQAATYLDVSESWVRRHLSDLPHSLQGRLIRFDPGKLKSKEVGRKPLESIRRLMPNNRYQQGGVYRRRKHKDTWYGTYRIDTSEGRKPVNLRLGTTQELVTKAVARQKLHEMIVEMSDPGAVTSTAKSMRYSDLVEKWKRSEGPAMSDNTLKHYSDALRAYVLPTWKDYAIDSIQREDITNLLNSQGAKYSRSSLKSMRLCSS